MYGSNDGGGCLRILGAIGSLLGIVAALVTIVAYVYPDRDEFIDELSNISQIDVEPVLDSLEDIRLEVVNFSDGRIYIPIILAVVLILVSIGYGSVASEEWDVFSTGEAILAGLGVFLVMLPCTLCWIWIYSENAGETLIGLFLAGQLISAVGSSIFYQY